MTQVDGAPIFCETCGAQLYTDSKFCPQCGMECVFNREDEIHEAQEDSTGIKLFQVYSLVNNFRYKDVFYDNVKVTWFILDREKPHVPFEKVINRYTELSFKERVFPENYIRGLFTKEEAEVLKRFMVNVMKSNAFIEACHLPVSSAARGQRDSSSVPGVDFFTLYKRSNYTLPFKVEGVFNIKMADERVMSDDRITAVTKIDYEALKKYMKKEGPKT